MDVYLEVLDGAGAHMFERLAEATSTEAAVVPGMTAVNGQLAVPRTELVLELLVGGAVNRHRALVAGPGRRVGRHRRADRPHTSPPLLQSTYTAAAGAIYRLLPEPANSSTGRRTSRATSRLTARRHNVTAASWRHVDASRPPCTDGL